MSWEDTIKKESKLPAHIFDTKRKLKDLLKILESDMDDFSKVGYAKGFVEGMLTKMK